ncbi:MAG: RNA-binding S4 domain-containing protein [Clostridia bacterium]|nr:RNA-binding S4 domain-containing protein [Clostridia bacterium]
MNEIKITTEYIKLDQLIKFAGLSFDGAEAKEMIKAGIVSVNGEKEDRRGRKIYPDDVVLIEFEDENYSIKVIK